MNKPLKIGLITGAALAGAITAGGIGAGISDGFHAALNNAVERAVQVRAQHKDWGADRVLRVGGGGE
jgi:hypothetical protein